MDPKDPPRRQGLLLCLSLVNTRNVGQARDLLHQKDVRAHVDAVFIPAVTLARLGLEACKLACDLERGQPASFAIFVEVPGPSVIGDADPAYRFIADTVRTLVPRGILIASHCPRSADGSDPWEETNEGRLNLLKEGGDSPTFYLRERSLVGRQDFVELGGGWDRVVPNVWPDNVSGTEGRDESPLLSQVLNGRSNAAPYVLVLDHRALAADFAGALSGARRQVDSARRFGQGD